MLHGMLVGILVLGALVAIGNASEARAKRKSQRAGIAVASRIRIWMTPTPVPSYGKPMTLRDFLKS